MGFIHVALGAGVVVYVEGDAAGGSSMTWTVSAGETPAGF